MSRFHWGWRISLVYTAFALSTLGFVAFAMTQRVDLVRDDYYQESLRTTAAQDELARGRTAGVEVAIHGPMIRITITDTTKRPSSLMADLYRPDDPSLDQHHVVTVADNGAYEVPLVGVVSGSWRVKLQWKVDGVAFARDQAMMLP